MRLPMKQQVAHSREEGTILIVVVAMLALVGALTLLGVGSFKTIDNQDLIRRTSLKEEFLIGELSAYAQRTNTVPCPADPAVSPTLPGFGFSQSPCVLTDGILPFRTLNLSQHDAIDGWNHYMTYRISPVLIDTTTGDPNVGNTIFMRCRRFPWFDGSPVAGPFNVFPQKARFCCPPDDKIAPAADLKVYSSLANLAANLPIDGIGRIGSAGGYYKNIDTPVSNAEVAGGTQGALNAIPAAAGNEEMFAVAIISHGQNGLGAHVPNATGGAQLGAATSAEEILNSNGGSQVIDRPVNTTPGLNYFDDIVIWRTQIGLMGALNNGSCYMPWR